MRAKTGKYASVVAVGSRGNCQARIEQRTWTDNADTSLDWLPLSGHDTGSILPTQTKAYPGTGTRAHRCAQCFSAVSMRLAHEMELRTLAALHSRPCARGVRMASALSSASTHTLQWRVRSYLVRRAAHVEGGPSRRLWVPACCESGHGCLLSRDGVRVWSAAAGTRRCLLTLQLFGCL